MRQMCGRIGRALSRTSSLRLQRRRCGHCCKRPRSVPIVFAIVADPVGAGYVESLARPGGNVTGFIVSNSRLQRKWSELLKEIAPGVTRVAVLCDPGYAPGSGSCGAIQAAGSVARSGIESGQRARRRRNRARRCGIRARSEWRPDRDGEPFTIAHRELIIALAARHAYPRSIHARYFVAAGGLISYGADFSTSTAARPATSTASSRARSRPTCRCRRRPSTNW